MPVNGVASSSGSVRDHSWSRSSTRRASAIEPRTSGLLARVEAVGEAHPGTVGERREDGLTRRDDAVGVGDPGPCLCLVGERAGVGVATDDARAHRRVARPGDCGEGAEERERHRRGDHDRTGRRSDRRRRRPRLGLCVDGLRLPRAPTPRDLAATEEHRRRRAGTTAPPAGTAVAASRAPIRGWGSRPTRRRGCGSQRRPQGRSPSGCRRGTCTCRPRPQRSDGRRSSRARRCGRAPHRRPRIRCASG